MAAIPENLNPDGDVSPQFTTPTTNRLEKTSAQVEVAKSILGHLKTVLQKSSQTEFITPWIHRIEAIEADEQRSEVIIGIVGATGAGKSAVINALLGEKQLLPTNCMRACTAVPTEVSFNDHSGSSYRAKVVFIGPDELRRELNLLFADLGDDLNRVHDEESEAGIAFAKITAVFPQINKHNLSNYDVEDLMLDPFVTSVLNEELELEAGTAAELLANIKPYVDSKDKTKRPQAGPQSPPTTREPAYWPLVRKVCVYAKAPVLRSGCVLVDLPGVGDSNAARGTVASNYIQHCNALWIVAPIVRAVDDHIARGLLNQGFKRQLDRDGTLSRLSFICSKSDDLKISEARSVLEQNPDFLKLIQTIDREKEDLAKNCADLQEEINKIQKHTRDLTDRDGAASREQKLLKNNGTVFTTDTHQSDRGLQSKRPGLDGINYEESSKRIRLEQRGAEQYDDLPVGPLELATSSILSDGVPESTDRSRDTEHRIPTLQDTTSGSPTRLVELESVRKEIRAERRGLRPRKQALIYENGRLDSESAALQQREWVACVFGRNKHSTLAIQDDFIAGLEDLRRDQTQDSDDFDPSAEVQENGEHKNKLPVFCVSADGYQKLMCRMEDERTAANFSTPAETGIPALRNHVYQMGEIKRLAELEAYVSEVQRLLTSLQLWSTDNNARNATRTDVKASSKDHVGTIDQFIQELNNIARATFARIKSEINTKVISNLPYAVRSGTSNAVAIAAGWGAPLQSDPPGLHWATYRATVRRDGEFSNDKRQYSFNGDLVEPFRKPIDGQWSRVFNGTIASEFDTATQQLNAEVADFKDKLAHIASTNGYSPATQIEVQSQLVRFTKSLKELLGRADHMITKMQRDANRLPTARVQNLMHDTYKACYKETGSGSFRRMKETIESRLQANGHDIFREAGDCTKESLDQIVEQIEGIIIPGIEASCSSFRRDCGFMVSQDSDNFESLDGVLRDGIMEILEQAKDLVESSAVSEPSDTPLPALEGMATPSEGRELPALDWADMLEDSGDESSTPSESDS